MIGYSKMNERLHGMTPNRMLLDVSEPPKMNKYNTNLILMRFCLTNIHCPT